MDCTVVKAVPFYCGAWGEGVFVLDSVAGWDAETPVIVSDVVTYNICSVEVSWFPGSYESAVLSRC